MGRLFVTGFGPFEGFEQNPSEALVSSLEDYCAHILPVSFKAIDSFLSSGLPDGHDRLLMVGVRSGGKRMSLERTARNFVGARPDVDGEVRGPAPVFEGGADTLPGKLFEFLPMRGEGWRSSNNAGSYLCNFMFYEAARRLEGVRCGFLHVPPFDVMHEPLQLRVLDGILSVLSKRQ